MRWLRSFIAWIGKLFTKKMRRKISLYIADQLVDLDDQSFILFNHAMDDLSNPTVVRNSFSQQITLKGTPTNNRIFGGAYRTDRSVFRGGGESGADFDPSRKTPFSIYNELNEIIVSGYVKLDSVSRNGADIQYRVTLYGGLGSFFYSLSYDENGNRRTLADLDYLGTSNPDGELDFTINAASVQEAWNRLAHDDTAPEKWDVINFAPAYNGIPDGNFSPDKGLVDPTDVGLQDSITSDGVTYGTRSGYALVNLANPVDEWAAKDLRSYLQRPVFSMKAFWNAICNPANNGGYEVDADAVLSSETFGDYSGLWMTLPMIPSIGTMQSGGGLSLVMSSSPTTGNGIGRWDITGGSVPSGTTVTANIHCRMRWNLPSGADTYDSLFRAVAAEAGQNRSQKFSAIFIQCVAYASDDTVVGGSRIKFTGLSSRETGAALASACGFTPVWPSEYERVTIGEFGKAESGVFEIPYEVGFRVEAMDVAYYRVMVSVYAGTATTSSGSGGSSTTVEYTGDGTSSIPKMYADYDTSFTPTAAFIVSGSSSDTISYTAAETLRSGALITKRMLLSSSHTPAEYMISFCKVFGLYFDYDDGTKKVTILRRNDLYRDEIVDLSERVDRSKGISLRPMVFESKWYDFSLEGVGGAFQEEYGNVEGIPYGIQRVNTGYDFNSESVNVMDSVVFKDACTILGKSKYFNSIFKNQVFQPSPFLDKGNTYTLWSADGDTLDTDISCPPDSATVEYFNDNPAYRGYDIDEARKLELRDAENKPVDGADILVFMEGWNGYDYFKLTDDVPAMDVLNDGVPCWFLGAGDAAPDALRIPIFQRYRYGNPSVIEQSLDFGVPRQFDIPGVLVFQGSTVYEKGWKKYMADRYDVNTKVMTCHVDFSGMQVNRELLRKFYWYDYSFWVLNRIINHSLTTYDPVECEFVQVQDRDNYLNGQEY